MSDEKPPNVIRLAERVENAAFQTPLDTLREMIEYLEHPDRQAEGAYNPNKMLILFLDDRGGDQFTVRFAQAGMRMSECLTVSVVGQTIFLGAMRYVVTPE